MRTALILCLLSTSALAAPAERRLHTDDVAASTFLWNDWNKFVENYHPNYIADDDPKTAWVEGAKSSGNGEWVRVNVTPLDGTTKVRLRIRNGYQKSKDLYRANARAKDVTVRLLPSKVEKKVSLEDKDGWQEIAIEQPEGELRSVQLNIDKVFEGSKYADLCISDVQVFATSETADNPAFEKSKRARLMQWRAARIAAAKLFTGKTDIPLYPAYEITSKPGNGQYNGFAPEDLIVDAQADPGFQEWKDALGIAAAALKNTDSLTRVQIAPRASAKLVEVDGVKVTDVSEIATGEGPYIEADSFRLPMLGTVSALFADQLRVLDLKDTLKISTFESARGGCKDTFWAARSTSKEAASQLQVLAFGRCARVEGREGSYNARVLEFIVYDANGRAVLVAGDGYVDAYRWVMDGTKPMIASARSMRQTKDVVEAKKREAVAAAGR